MTKLKPRREGDRARSAESTVRGPKLSNRKFRNDDRTSSASVERFDRGRDGQLPNCKFRSNGGTILSSDESCWRGGKLSNQRSRKDRSTTPVGNFKLSDRDNRRESSRRPSSRDGEVLSSLRTIKKKSKYDTPRDTKESWHEDAPKRTDRVTRFDPDNTLRYGKTFKKKTMYNTATDTEDGSLEDRPKRKKRVIRIDPHDISNKRLDDSTPLPSDAVEEEENKSPAKESELSQNAQFRAIQPSPSILSFVEDNLLGRRRSIELKRAGYNIDLSVPLDNIPLSTSSEREPIEETVFKNKLTFFAAAKVSSSFPPPEAPEVAFAGRSNVGKSSLLNALTRQWGVVRTSDKPGLTQTINFFQLGPKLRLVDLPGYGFAYAKEEVKDAWEELVKEYVSSREGLKRVCLLIDTKWGMKPRDRELINIMERSQTKYQIVLTKTDTVFPVDVARRASQIEDALKVSKSVVHPVMMVSTKSGAGIRTLRTALSKIARFAKI